MAHIFQSLPVSSITSEELQSLPSNLSIDLVSESSSFGLENLLSSDCTPTKFLYAQIEKSVVQEESKRQENITCTSTDEEDEGEEGSPLEYPMEGVDAQPQPCTISDARTLLSIYAIGHNLHMQNGKCTSDEKPELWGVPLWVQCDGNDKQKTYLMGVRATEDGKRGSLITTSVSCEGPVQERNDLPDLRQMLGSVCTSSQGVSTSAFAEYEILGVLPPDTSMTESTSTSSGVTLECSWTNVHSLLEEPTCPQCTLKIFKGEGKLLQTTPLVVLAELNLLKSFADGLKTGEIVWPLKEYSHSMEDIVPQFLQDMRENPAKYFKTRFAGADDSGDSESKWQNPFERSRLDFTERLWLLIVDHASCYDDVITTFQLVEKDIKSGHLPMVNSANNTTIGKKIRILYKEQTTESFDLSEESPLELLLEIGIHKLRKDFTDFFIAEELATGNQVASYSPGKDDEVDVSDQFQKLKGLHNVAEMAILAQRSLQLTTSSTLTLIRSALTHYSTHSAEASHIFSLAVDSNVVHKFYKGNLPSIWRVEITDVATKKIPCIVHLSTKPPLEHVDDFSQSDATLAEVRDDSIHYFLTRIKETTLNFF